MPYRPPFFLFNKHLETIYPALFRKVDFDFKRFEKISTPDDDILEVGSTTQNSNRLVILSHGLEGDMSRPYIRGMAEACFASGFDVMAWNYRGCGREMNRRLRFYHSGATDDLETVINHAVKTKQYSSINLVGFSLGGNITLKYMGEERERPNTLDKVVVFSTPLHLSTSCDKIMMTNNFIYHNRFLRSLKKKIIAKSRLMSGLNVDGIQSIRKLKLFDDRYTAALHGFANADVYYDQCSSLRYVSAIQTKTLIVNAANDPFLSKECYPVELLKDHPFVTLEVTRFGGHCGFTQRNKEKRYWSEKRALEFLTQRIDT